MTLDDAGGLAGPIIFYYGKGPRYFKGVGLLGEQNKNERGKRPCKGNHPKEERQNQEDGEIVI